MIQIILAGITSLVVSILLTPVLIKVFRAKSLGQQIRLDGPKTHLYKSGTPAMGGIAIIVGIWSGYLITHSLGKFIGYTEVTATGLLILALASMLGCVGFIDDYIKLKKQRNLGLTKTAKFLGQLIAGILFAVLALRFPNSANLHPASTKISFIRDIDALYLSSFLFIIFCWFIISAWSNAVNFTDGLDGLASGSLIMTFGSYVLITFWQFKNNCNFVSEITSNKCYAVRDPLDIAIVAVSTAAAVIGFLWWNVPPAKIFMGDTGSLALGGLLAGISIVTKTELLAIALGFIFVLEMFSVSLQILSFKITGKRVFKMAPIHHHFELIGWEETTIIIRFWIIAGIACALGLAIFYGEFINL